MRVLNLYDYDLALTGGNILRVSYIVLHRRKSSKRKGSFHVISRCVRYDPFKSWDIFVSLHIQLGLAFRAIVVFGSHW